MASKSTDDEIASFNSEKRLKIDDYFKDQMNKIDIKVAEITSSIANENTDAPTTSSHYLQIENLEKIGKNLIDEIEKIRAYNLVQFESNKKEIIDIYSANKSLANSDEINKLAFKRFCFLYNIGIDVKKEGKTDEKMPLADTIEDSEAINKLKLKLVISDWYLNENQLELIRHNDNENRNEIGVLSKEIIINNHIEEKLKEGLIIQIQRSEIMDTKTEFEMRDKKITSIKELTFIDFRILKCLNLSNNQIADLNENIFTGLSQLEVLNLTKNKLKSLNLKTVFSQLSSLKELSLRENEIDSLPENSFELLCNLEKLDLFSNKLKSVNDSMFSRDLTKLTEINMSQNEISVFSMEADHGKLPNLEKLNLNETNLAELKANKFKSLHNLKQLDLSASKIATIELKSFTGLAKLEELNMRENQISKLEEKLFYDLVNLKSLDVSENKLAKIKLKTFDNLLNLEKLNVSANLLDGIDPGVFSELTSLKELTIYNNAISKIDSDSFKGLFALEELDMRFNDIKAIKQNVFNKLKNLKMVNFSHNGIDKVEDNSFDGLDSLEQIYLEYNPIEQVNSEIFTHLPGIKELYIFNGKIEFS
jgi:Leucine-rich repeat (LRR) protein